MVQVTAAIQFPHRAYMLGHDGDYRCAWCDGRYCWSGCGVDTPGWVYVKGTGWRPEGALTPEQAAAVECRECGGTMGSHALPDCRNREHRFYFLGTVEQRGMLRCECSCGWQVHGPEVKVFGWAQAHLKADNCGSCGDPLASPHPTMEGGTCSICAEREGC